MGPKLAEAVAPIDAREYNLVEVAEGLGGQDGHEEGQEGSPSGFGDSK